MKPKTRQALLTKLFRSDLLDAIATLEKKYNCIVSIKTLEDTIELYKLKLYSEYRLPAREPYIKSEQLSVASLQKTERILKREIVKRGMKTLK